MKTVAIAANFFTLNFLHF